MKGGHQCPGHSPTTSFLIDALSFVSACLLPSQLLGLPQLVASHWSTQSSEAEPQAGYLGGSQGCTEAVSGVDRLGGEVWLHWSRGRNKNISLASFTPSLSFGVLFSQSTHPISPSQG